MRNPLEVGFLEGIFNLFAEQKRNVAPIIHSSAIKALLFYWKILKCPKSAQEGLMFSLD